MASLRQILAATFFKRLFPFFQGPTPTDNGCVNIIKYGKDFASCTETPNPKVIDVNTLETVAILNLMIGFRDS